MEKQREVNRILKQRLSPIYINDDGEYCFSFFKRKRRYAKKFDRIKYNYPFKLKAMVVWERLKLKHKITDESLFPLQCSIPEGYHILHPEGYTKKQLKDLNNP